MCSFKWNTLDIFVIWWITKQSVFLVSEKASNKVPTYANINILGLKSNVL